MKQQWVRMMVLAGSACALMVGTAAWAQPGPGGPGGPKGRGPGNGRAMMQRMDTNSDGAISRDEFLAAHKARFEAMDTNKDGVLSKEELAAGWGGMREGRRGQGAGAQNGKAERGQRRGPGAADTNGDGTISYDEAVAMHPGLTEEQFKARDTNGDGVWSPADRGGMREDKLDANDDGKVTLDEFQAAGAERFKQMDTNGDGLLTSADRPERPEPRKGAPEPPANAPAAQE